MKNLLLALVFAAVGPAAFGQGTIQFANSFLTRLNTNTIGTIGIGYGSRGLVVNAMTPMFYAVFVGTEPESNRLSLANPGDPSKVGQSSDVSPGLIVLPDGSAPNIYPIAGYTNGQWVYLQIRAWSQAAGPASANGWLTAQYSCCHYYGWSIIQQVRLGPHSGPGTVIWNHVPAPNRITPFDIYLPLTVPEASTALLVGLGLAGLIFLRRRK